MVINSNKEIDKLDKKALEVQMLRKERSNLIRHPFLLELEKVYYQSLNCINLAPKKAFSIDIFPKSKEKPSKGIFKKCNWICGSFLSQEENDVNKNEFLKIIRKLLPLINRKKKIVFPNTFNCFCFPDQSFDYVESLATIPWTENLERSFIEIHRLLQHDGFFGFASFGPTSLKEFIYNLKELDYNLSKQSFLPLIDLHDLGDVCGSVGFESAVVSSEKVLFKYKKPESALKELRRLSGNPLIDRSKIVSGKNWYKSILFALDKCRDSSGLVTLEFEMIYGHAWKKQKTSENPLTKKNSNEDFFIKEKKIKFFS